MLEKYRRGLCIVDSSGSVALRARHVGGAALCCDSYLSVNSSASFRDFDSTNDKDRLVEFSRVGSRRATSSFPVR